MVSPIIQMLSNKHSGVSGLATQLLVLHSGESPLRGGYAQSLTNWACIPLNQGGPEASWHWFVDPIAIVQMVLPEFYAWHASEANAMSEGFEQAGYARFTRAEWTTPEGLKQLENLGWIMAQRCRANNIPPVWLTTAQVEAVTKGGNRSIKGLCLHRQIDPETRTDPGDGYPYDLLLASIKKHLGLAPASSTPKENTLSAAEVKQITAHITKEAEATRKYVGQLLTGGYTMGGDKIPGGNAVGIETQRRVSIILELLKAQAANQNLTAEDITAAVDAALASGVVKVDISVAGAE